MRSRFVTIMVVGLVAASCTQDAREAGESAARPVVKAAFVPAGYYLPFLIVEADSLLEKRGYSLELVRFNDNSHMVNLFINRGLDVAAQSALTMLQVLEEHPDQSFKFVYGQYAQSYAFVVPVNSPYRSLDQISGETIATWRSPTAVAFISLLLGPRGLTQGEDYQVARYGATEWAPALENGVQDIAFGFDVVLEGLVQSGQFRLLEQNALSSLLSPNRVFNGGGFIHESLIGEDPAKAEAIREAFLEAVSIINEEPDRARRVAGRRLGLPESTVLSALFDEYSPIDSIMIDAAYALEDLMLREGLLGTRVVEEAIFWR